MVKSAVHSGSWSTPSDLLAVKPERITPLTPDQIAELRGMPNLVIAEMAGRDAAAAIMACLPDDDVQVVLPVAVYMGAEYGHWQGFEENAAFCREQAQEKYGKQVLEVLWLGSPELWRALNGRRISDMISRFGKYSPCLACHFYLHAIRIPLAKQLGVKVIIGGDREQHNDRAKINQIAIAIEAYQRFMTQYGIDLREPLRHVSDVADVDALLGPDWPGGSPQPACMFSRNFETLEEKDSWTTEDVQTYIDGFVYPMLDRIITAHVDGQDIDYDQVAREVIAQKTHS